MKFLNWIADQGGTVEVGRLLGVSHFRVRAWLQGKSTPQALVMQKIVRLSRGRVTYDDIINDTKKAAHCAQRR